MRKLTGRYYHKKTLLGLVLMVEELFQYRSADDPFGYDHSYVQELKYRKAKQQDLLDLEIK